MNEEKEKEEQEKRVLRIWKALVTQRPVKGSKNNEKTK